MKDMERNYLNPGDSVSLALERGGDPVVEFEIQSVAGEGGTAVCYEARMVRDGYQETGKLKEFYPIASGGVTAQGGNRLVRGEDGQLYAEGDFLSFAEECRAYIENTGILWKKMESLENEVLRNVIQIGDVFYGDGESATVYVWTIGEAGISLKQYLEEVRKAPEKQSESKLRNILKIMISLTKCVKLLHTAGFMHLDIKPDNFFIPYESYPKIDPNRISLLDIDTMHALDESLDTHFVGTKGYCAPEVRSGAADNRSDIYSIGATLFYAIVIDSGISGNGRYQDCYYSDIDVLVKNSSLISSSVSNSDNRLVQMLANILKKCLARNPEDRFERCGELLDSLEEAEKKSMESSGKRETGSPDTAIRKLLYDHPLYEMIPLSEDTEEIVQISVLAVGSGNYGQKFMDICLEAGQMKGYELSVMAFSEKPDEDRESYIRFRPDAGRFVDIDGSMESSDEKPLGRIRFAPVAGTTGEIGFLPGREAEKLRKNRALADELLSSAEKKAGGYDYIFVALGDDELNMNVAELFAEAVRDRRGDCGCTIAYVWEDSREPGGPNDASGPYPVCISRELSLKNIDEQLEQMAFNTDLSWSDSLNLDLNRAFKNFREDSYRYNSSMAFALSLKYKLFSVGIVFEGDRKVQGEMPRRFRTVKDAAEAAKIFSDEILVPAKTGDVQARANYDTLVWLEHRRWVLEMVTNGWRAPLDQKGELMLEECVNAGSVKNFAKRTHPCIVFSTEATPLESAEYTEGKREKWEDPDIDPKLDELDRMSVRLHQCFRRRAGELAAHNMLYGGETELIRRRIADAPENVLRAFRQFRFCLQNILDGIESYTRQYGEYRSAFLNSLGELPEPVRKETENRMALIDRDYFPVIEANMYRNYKKNDEILIDKIPFILTFRSVPGIVMAFEDGLYQNGKNEAVFGDVAAATVLCPQNIFYLYCFEKDSSADLLIGKLESVLTYMKNRAMCCRVHMTIACADNVEDKERKKLEKALEKLKREHDNTETAEFMEGQILSCSDRDDMSRQLLEYIRGLSDVVYDGSTSLFHSLAEDGEMVRHVREMGLPYFEFDWRHKKFVEHRECDYLNYVREGSHLRISDMFALMNATDNRTSLPEFMEDYKTLWEIYTGAYPNGPGFSNGVRNWNRLCELLDDYGERQGPLASLRFPSEGRSAGVRMVYELPEYTFTTVKYILGKLIEYDIVDAESSLQGYTSETCQLELIADPGYRDSFDRLFSRPELLLPYYGVEAGLYDDVVRITCDRMKVENLNLDPEGRGTGTYTYRLLQVLQEKRYIHQLKEDSDDPMVVSFDYSSPRIKHLLTKGGEILEIYAYYKVMETGYFDDVATGYEFNWEDGGVSNELDLILTKDFRSMIVECKAVQKLELNYYHKLHSLAEHFGIGTIKVMIGNTYRHNQDDINEVNRMQRSRGTQLNIKTISNKEQMDEIGETLKKLMAPT